jgi:hypothetical protein
MHRFKGSLVAPFVVGKFHVERSSPEGDEEEIERADDGWHHTANISWPEYFQGPSSSIRSTQRQPGGRRTGISTDSTVGAAIDNWRGAGHGY